MSAKQTNKPKRKGPIMAKKSDAVTIDGQEFSSKVAAARDLYGKGKTVKEILKILVDAGYQITYASVYAYTKGNEKTESRRAKYRILNMGKTGRKTASEIAGKTGVSTSKVVSVLKNAGVAVMTKEALAKRVADAGTKEPAVKEETPKVKAKVAKKSKRAPDPRKPKAKKVIVVEESVEGKEAIQEAMADMN